MTEERTLTVHREDQHLLPALSIEQAINRHNAIVEFVARTMRSGVDYGAIPGTDKATLLKPGAERLTTYFGLTPTFTIVEKIEDWTGDGHGGEPFFYYWYRCHLGRHGQLVAEADGSCNSRERKYRWRWVAEEDLPPGLAKASLKVRGGTAVEFAFAVEKAETAGQYGKPAEYWRCFEEAIASGTARSVKKATRAGRQFDAWEIDTAVYRVPNEEIPGQVNTIQKMAQKRALVAATLIAVNASEFFTQDLEDLAPAGMAQHTVSRPGGEGQKGQPAPGNQHKCPVCQASGQGHAPWCRPVDGQRVDTRQQGAPAASEPASEPGGAGSTPNAADPRSVGPRPSPAPVRPGKGTAAAGAAPGHSGTTARNGQDRLDDPRQHADGQQAWKGAAAPQDHSGLEGGSELDQHFPRDGSADPPSGAGHGGQPF